MRYVKIIRTSRKIKIKTVAGLLNLSVSKFSEYERGLSELKSDKLALLSEFFKLPARDLEKMIDEKQTSLML
jgi:transcriptional regulator with XRE-family HTH domain